ncbi:MAG TPA: DNA-3-methyladenine glycosylase I [Longimicrobiales bacterium]|nr:DNA-3-methyladenine glycosylase I [Longimicrobiales bacterium]
MSGLAIPGPDGRPRCPWCLGSEEMIAYHDREWGVPVRDDATLFEYVLLDTFQAGLSWAIVLRKRAGFRAAFAGFDPERIARFDDADVARLLADPGIVRNRLKVRAAITNAQAWLELVEEHGAAAPWFWAFVEGEPKRGGWRTQEEVPATSPESDAMSDALRERGFKFVGSTICYAFMQAAGLVNDHLVGCHRIEAV